MHIHANLMNQAANFYDSNSLRAEQAERAARTRRKLQKAAQAIDADLATADPAAGMLMGQWLSVNHNQSLADDRYMAGPTHYRPFPG